MREEYCDVVIVGAGKEGKGTFGDIFYENKWNITFIDKDDLKYCFPEFEELNNECKFRGCLHHKEPGCAIKEAVEEGKINSFRYEFYIRTLEEILEGRKYRW